MPYVRRTKPHSPIEVSYRNRSDQRTGTYYRRIDDSYSWRTGQEDFQTGQVVGGALNLTPYGGNAGRLAAEISAIQEVNETLKSSSVLKEGTWGTKDAGHVFGLVKSKAAMSVLTDYIGTPRLLASERIAPVFFTGVDPFSWKIFSQLNSVKFKDGHQWTERYAPVYPFADLADECSRLLIDSSPDLSAGGFGETLAEIHSIPGLLRSVYDMRLIATTLYKRWVKLSDKVKREVNLGFRVKGVTKDMSKEGASAYLQWSFALKPLIEDSRMLLEAAMGLSHTLTSSTSRVRKIPHRMVEKTGLDGQGYFKYKGFSSLTNPVNDLDVGSISAVPWTGHANEYGGFTSFSDLDVRVALRYRLVKPVRGWQEQAIILNQKLGVVYPSLLWDLSPWSFLIDWFSHIGRSIDGVFALTKGRYSPDYCWATAKCRSSVIWHGTRRDWGNSYQTLHFNGSPFTESTGRIPISQWGGLKPYFGSLNTNQKKLLTALGFTRLK